MERRDFLKFVFGAVAGAGAIAAAATAASAAPMLSPHDLMNGPKPEPDVTAKPAVADQDDLARAEPEQVHWRHRHWRRHHRRHHRRYHRHHRRHYRRHYRRW